VIEARIKCLCPAFHLADLGLNMLRGDIKWVPEKAARSSGDLRLAVHSGAVAVVYTRRCFVSRSPPPPNVRMNRTTRGVPTKTATKPTVAPQSAPAPAPPPSNTPVPMPEVSAQFIREAITEGVTKAIAELLSSGVLVPNVGGMPGATRAVSALSVTTAEPVYIPTNIVPTDNAPIITVAKSSTEGTDLEAASSALKATRKRKANTSSETP
jgi:hypothetical protein